MNALVPLGSCFLFPAPLIWCCLERAFPPLFTAPVIWGRKKVSVWKYACTSLWITLSQRVKSWSFKLALLLSKDAQTPKCSLGGAWKEGHHNEVKKKKKKDASILLPGMGTLEINSEIFHLCFWFVSLDMQLFKDIGCFIYWNSLRAGLSLTHQVGFMTWFRGHFSFSFLDETGRVDKITDTMNSLHGVQSWARDEPTPAFIPSSQEVVSSSFYNNIKRTMLDKTKVPFSWALFFTQWPTSCL